MQKGLVFDELRKIIALQMTNNYRVCLVAVRKYVYEQTDVRQARGIGMQLCL